MSGVIRGCRLLGSVSIVALLSTAASAQEAASASGTGVDAPAAVESDPADIVVTAQRRAESIQDVPVSVSAFSSAGLRASRLDGGADLQLAVPNVSYSRTNFGNFNFQIRGIGTKLFGLAVDQGVSIHTNDSPITLGRLGDAEFYDVERVEVLRGPQGTLFGRNATGGVVNAITAKPTDELSGSATVEVGNYNSLRLKGFINVPVTDTLAVRAAGFRLVRDGYGTNLANGADIDGRNQYAIRLTARWEPLDTVRATLLWDGYREDSTRSRRALSRCIKDSGPSSVGGVAVSANNARYLNQGCAAGSLYGDAARQTPDSRGTVLGVLGTLTGLMTTDVFAGQTQSESPYDINSWTNPSLDNRNDLFQAIVEVDLSDKIKLSSNTTYTEDVTEAVNDPLRIVPGRPFNTAPEATTPFAPVFPALFPGGFVNDPQLGLSNLLRTLDESRQTGRQFNQELRLQSDFGGVFDFSVGGLYLWYNTESKFIISSNGLTSFAQASNAANGCTAAGSGGPRCIGIDLGSRSSGEGHNYFNSTGNYTLRSNAVFGEVYVRPSSELAFTIGLRYTDDQKTNAVFPIRLLQPGFGVTQNGEQKVGFQELTGRGIVTWTPQRSNDDETLVYASYSRGYKGGGFNPPQAAGSTTLFPQTFLPEFVDAFEIGTKNTFFDRTLTLNASAFYYRYNDYQISTIVNISAITENVSAEIWGAELEAVWRPTRSLRLNATIGYLSTEIGEGSSIDIHNRTQGDPSLTLVKSSGGGNCTVPTAALANVLAIQQGATGAPVIPGISGNPIALLAACSGGLAALGVTPSPGKPVDLAGNELPNSPNWTISLGAQYDVDLSTDWRATLRGDYYRVSDSYARTYNSVSDLIRGWDNINATVSLNNDNAGVEVQFFVKNLLNSVNITDALINDDILGLVTNTFVKEPRQFGLSVTYRY